MPDLRSCHQRSTRDIADLANQSLRWPVGPRLDLLAHPGPNLIAYCGLIVMFPFWRKTAKRSIWEG